jgi:endoglucanase
VSDHINLSYDLPLLGVNFSGAGHAPEAIPGRNGTHYFMAQRDHFQRWAKEGVRAVRLGFNWERIQPTLNGPLDREHMAWLKSCLDWAEEFGMKILLDMHNYLRRRVFDNSGKCTTYLIGSSQVPVSAFNDGWTRIVAAVKDHPALLGYGIMNQPYNTNGSWPKIAQSCIDAIRGQDPTGLIFVAGDRYANAQAWATANPAFPLKGENLVYEAHGYFDGNGSGHYSNRSEAVHIDIGVKRFTPFIEWCQKHKVAGVIGETGAPADMPSAQAALDRALEYLFDKKVPVFYFAAGPGWSASAPSGIEVDGTLREPITILRKYCKHATWAIGPA